MKQMLSRRELQVFFSLALLLLTGCFGKTTPPGANIIYGGVDDARYTYLYWQEGLNVLFWHDLNTINEGCNGHSSTDDPIYRITCDIEGQDGVDITLEIHSTDGIAGEMWLNEQPIDLAQGTLFLLTMENGAMQFQQLARDFSQLTPDNASIELLAESDADIAAFVAGE